MSGAPVHVAMCIDKGFTLPLAVAMASLDAAGADDALTVHVVHPGLPDETRKRLTAHLVSARVVWHEVDERRFDGTHHSVFLSPASLFRLCLGEILPAELTRVIYLDADVIVARSLRDLYATDLGDAVLGAVPDALAPWAAGPLGPPWRELGRDPSSANMNSGVLLIDLRKWREADVGGSCLELLRASKPRWGDQDALNTVLEGRWLSLPRHWNTQTGDLNGTSIAWALWTEDVESAVREPAIVHYTERDKPWNHGSEHPAAELWYEWLDRTAWSGWRPSAPEPNPVAEQLLRWARQARDRWESRRASTLPG